MMQKMELGANVVDDSRSFDIVEKDNKLYITLYYDTKDRGNDDEGNWRGYEMDACHYICDVTSEITKDSMTAAITADFDKCVGLAEEQETYRQAQQELKQAQTKMDGTDYRKTKFVCQLIDTLASGCTLEDLQSLAKKFLEEYPDETIRTEAQRIKKRSASKIIGKAEIGVSV